MSIYGVTGVTLDARGRVERVQMQQINGRTDQWVGRPGEYDAHYVAGLISTGDVVYPIFIVAGGNTVHGPKFRVAVYDHGFEGIELEEDIEGRRITDLIQG